MKVSFVMYYVDGTQKVVHFDNLDDYNWFKRMEGDHLLETRRFFPDEQHEEDYNVS